MRYALLIYCDEDTTVSDRERERREEQLTAILDGLRARGVLADTQRLLSARAARVVRCRDGGDIIITDGPAAQTREQLTGWVIAECEDLDGAVRLATTIPAARYGSVEIRPAGQGRHRGDDRRAAATAGNPP
jgi:hypothetical protein